MATLELNIYNKKDHNKIDKTYTAESYDLMLGTVEDIMEIVDIEKVADDMEVAKMLVKGYGLLIPLLKDIFEGVTDAELKRTKVKELVPLFVEIFKSVMDSLSFVKQGN